MTISAKYTSSTYIPSYLNYSNEIIELPLRWHYTMTRVIYVIVKYYMFVKSYVWNIYFWNNLNWNSMHKYGYTQVFRSWTLYVGGSRRGLRKLQPLIFPFSPRFLLNPIPVWKTSGSAPAVYVGVCPIHSPKGLWLSSNPRNFSTWNNKTHQRKIINKIISLRYM